MDIVDFIKAGHRRYERRLDLWSSWASHGAQTLLRCRYCGVRSHQAHRL